MTECWPLPSTPMEITNAGLHAGIDHGQEAPAISSIVVGGEDPHDIVAHVRWTEVKAEDDYPYLGTAAILVPPDGFDVLLGYGASGRGAILSNSAPLQGVTLDAPGRYRIEIRPIVTMGPEGMPLAGAEPQRRVLAAIPFEVLRD